jgi:hypothetical protein
MDFGLRETGRFPVPGVTSLRLKARVGDSAPGPKARERKRSQSSRSPGAGEVKVAEFPEPGRGGMPGGGAEDLASVPPLRVQASSAGESGVSRMTAREEHASQAASEPGGGGG